MACAGNRLEEHELADRVELNTVVPGESQTIGPFQIDFIRLPLLDAVRDHPGKSLVVADLVHATAISR